MLQALRAVAEVSDEATVERLRVKAGIPLARPTSLIPEEWFVRLVDAIREDRPDDAEALLARAGRYTADYVSAHRIPRPFKALLKALPDRWAVPLLLWAFRRHAWTFAGSSAFRVESADDGKDRTGRWHLYLDTCLTCRRPGDAAGGSFYAAAFEGLLRLASPHIHVREVTCRRLGADVCCFAAQLKPKDRP